MVDAKRLFWKIFQRIRNFLNRDGPEGRPTPNRDYHAFNAEYDEEVIADDLLASAHDTDRAAAEQSHQRFLNKWPDDLNSIRSAARQLVRRPDDDVIRAKDTDFALTILLDHSGSLRGERIGLVAAVATAFGEFCRNADIPFEILGFTTVSWKGAPVRDEWIARWRPPFPGRLCALRHIVYSSFDDFTEPDLTAMFTPDLLKENVDGEAVEWAASRFEQVLSERKVLIAVSDGAPVDDSTLSANTNQFLWNHLQEVVRRLASDMNIVMRGVGIEHDVTSIYPVSCEVKEIADVETDFLPMLASAVYDETNLRQSLR